MGSRLGLHHCARLVTALFFFITAGALAQYTEIDAVSNVNDPNLVNPWGMTILEPSSGIWLAENGTGKAEQFDPLGNLQQTLTIPAGDSAKIPGSPTGMVGNPQANFPIRGNGLSLSSALIFATFDGTISGWNPNISPSNAVIAVDNSDAGARYTGLAINTLGPPQKTFLYAADFAHNRVDIYDDSFKFVRSFSDPNTPPGLSVFGIQAINGNLFVTLGSFTPGLGGAIDIFAADGRLLRRLATSKPGGRLDGPWGLAIAPGDFGPLSNRLLVGNLNTGHIAAIDLNTGLLLDLMRDRSNVPITIPGLWGLQFGGGNPNVNGPTSLLFFTAGPNGYRKGLFGVISPTSGG